MFFSKNDIVVYENETNYKQKILLLLQDLKTTTGISIDEKNIISSTGAIFKAGPEKLVQVEDILDGNGFSMV